MRRGGWVECFVTDYWDLQTHVLKECVVACCSVLQRVEVCCSVLQCDSLYCTADMQCLQGVETQLL